MDNGEVPELYHFVWNNHGSTIINGLQKLRQEEIFCDATIVCDGKHFLVHRLILSCCSDYFKERFSETSHKHSFIELKDIPFDDFDNILTFMYEGEVSVPQERFQSFIQMGKTLRIKELCLPDGTTSKDYLAGSSEKLLSRDTPTTCEIGKREHENLPRRNYSEKRKGLCDSIHSDPRKKIKREADDRKDQILRNKGNMCNSADVIDRVARGKVQLKGTVSKEDSVLKNDGEMKEENNTTVEGVCDGMASSNVTAIIKTDSVSYEDAFDEEENLKMLLAHSVEDDYNKDGQFFSGNMCPTGSDQEFLECNDGDDSGSESFSFDVKSTLETTSLHNITVRCSYNTPDKRCWNKLQYCIYCFKGLINLTKHLLHHHSEEKDVLEVSNLPLKSPGRKLQLERIRNVGNFNHNCAVLKKGFGEIIPWRCPPIPVNYEDYVPCQYCYAFFYTRELFKHSKKCKFRSEIPSEGGTLCDFSSRKLITESRLLLPTKDNDKTKFHENIIAHMQPDEVTKVAENDPLINEFGAKKFDKMSHLPQQYTSVSLKMRELAAFLIAVRGLSSDIGDLSDVIDPAKFDVISEAICAKGSADEKKHNAFTLGNSLYECAYINKMLSVLKLDTVREKKCNWFMDWCRQERLQLEKHSCGHQYYLDEEEALPCLTQDYLITTSQKHTEKSSIDHSTFKGLSL